MSFAGKTYWLVGASEGLGRAVARQLAKEGAVLRLSARGAERLESLAAEVGNGATAHPLDIQKRDDVQRVASEIGAIDGVIFAAGVYWPMRAKDWDPEQVELMCDINFTGAARVLGTVVPEMVKRDAGHVVIIGSLSGFRGLPGAIGYGASKAGVMHLAENLQAELRGSGVKVQLVNPGFIKTRLTDKNDFKMPFVMEADQAATHVLAAMRSERFQSNFPRVFSWLFRAGNFLPAWLYYRIFGA